MALRALGASPYEILVATNQPAARWGYLSGVELDDLHSSLREQIENRGGRIDAFLVWRPEDPPSLRKPNPGLLVEAARERDLALGESWMVGDKRKDMLAGRSAGCRTILVNPALSARLDGASGLAAHRAKDLRGAVDIILGAPRNASFPKT